MDCKKAFLKYHGFNSDNITCTCNKCDVIDFIDSPNKQENKKVYAEMHPEEKAKIIFHGGCIECVTPIHYGLGNCMKCMYFESDWSKRDLSIINYSK